MKELTIEEKAKRYDEAIEFAHNKHRFSSNLSEIKLIEELFPELKEGDYDRIINNIKKAVEAYWSDEPLQEILAWLEKQSEQKQWDSVKPVSAEDKLYLMQGEQMPAIKLERDDNGEAVLTPFEAELFSMMSEAWQGYSFGEEVNIAKIVKEHSKELLEIANEQKPAWSEEDEYCLAGAIETELYMIDVVNGIKKFDVGNSSIEEECTRELAWLKSLKDRVQLLPKQEWSKDDDQYLLVCKNALKKYQITDKWDAHIISQWLEDKLKSLRPQNTWKPSDEQMIELRRVISGCSYDIEPLVEIEEHLKKLREE